jgi:hypothetical protein
MKMSRFARTAGLALVGLASSSPAALAEDATWEHTLAAYVMGASLDGSTGVGELSADVDVSFSDILDNLDTGFMFAYHGERGPWSVGLDFSFMELEDKASGLGPGGGTSASVESDQYIVQLDVGHALTERLGVYGGVRYTELDVDLKVVGGGPLGETLKRAGNESWADPVVGLRYEAPLGNRWQLVAKGDIGGFGVGSEFTWMATAFAAYSFNGNAMLLLGYRYLDVDYKDGNGADRFVWDVATSGPAAAFAWRF